MFNILSFYVLSTIYFRKLKKITSKKDLQTQNNLVNKRFLSKIEHVNDSEYKCRSCSNQFVTKISAMDHVKNPWCEGSKRKPKQKKIKCDVPECNLMFLIQKAFKNSQK